MSETTLGAPHAALPASRAGIGIVGPLLFLLAFSYYWITTEPFMDRAAASFGDPSAGASNLLNQLLGIGLFGLVMLTALRSEARSSLLRPRVLLGLLIAWFLVTALVADYPALAFRRVVLITMTLGTASAFLLLPRTQGEFARLLGLFMLAILGLCYFGVIALPHLAIHQMADVSEQALAGAWRGHFLHKNDASSAMIIAIFAGLFCMGRWSRFWGGVIVAGAALFLFEAGSKTTLGLLPLILLIAFVFERIRVLRFPIVFGGVLAFNGIVVGAALYRPLTQFVASLGIDATFTDRRDIWGLALSAISERPWTGYGFQSFWQTESLVYSGGDIETWAINASHAHNGYIEIWLAAGLPALLLALAFLLWQPMMDAGRAFSRRTDPAMTRLFLRIWLYCIFSAVLESSFFTNSGPVWFAMLVAIFGLGHLARTRLADAPDPSKRSRLA
ncbi:O-antigen ligase family protein [Arsenicitalea aurantiaca]|uniref:O-antigen ligase family protein n=1 Tax=Arsenicitalea aurantiaca TaxID=1783274 RepID=A0A433XKI9_9HYPH|nr:O-antigen ligase [Arsenicitalea aurantiaca]RUT34591.1 O-antigen ligase family protein [Arsenicitalea aurantiaca]